MRILSTTALLSILATSTFADGLTYGKFTLDYDRYSDGSSDYTQTELEGEIEYQMGQVLLSAEAHNTSYDGGGHDRDVNVGAGYMITPEALIGAGLQYYENDFGYEETGYEVFGQYQTDQYAFAVNLMKWADSTGTSAFYFGEATVAPEVTLGALIQRYSEATSSFYHLNAEYEAGAIFARAFYAGDTESDSGFVGVRGTYDINSMYRASAGMMRFTGDLAPDMTFIKVGGGVQVSDGLWIDAHYGFITGNDAASDVSRIQAVLTYEIGDRARVDRRMINALFDDFDFLYGPG